MTELPEGVRYCSRGPRYHWHGEWLVAFVLAPLVGAAIVGPYLPDGIVGFMLHMIVIFVPMGGCWHLFVRHADPHSPWLAKGGD